MGHYKGTKCTYNDFTFDSIDEKNYYIKLISDNRVEDLLGHPKFILLDGFRNYEGKALRSITFKPDFMYKIAGQVYIDDVKPINKNLIDADFSIRWKLLQHMYKDQDIKFRLMAWDKKKCEFVEM
jgi:Protein of unknown function (DUF1064).